MRIGILGSTRGSHLAALHDAFPADIKIVISNKKESGILVRAAEKNIPAEFIDPKNLSRENYDAKVNEQLQQSQVELIVLIGYMRILSSEFVQRWKNKIINVHPSLLPAHAGLMDLAVHQAVLAAKEKETGCSVHYVTEIVDAGPVILQKKCPVREDDSVETLKYSVQQLESTALIEALYQIKNGTIL